MIKMLRTTGILSLASACIILVICIIQWFQVVTKNEESSKNSTSTIEIIRQTNEGKEKTEEKMLFPLVEQAKIFASYLNPPRNITKKIQQENPRQKINTHQGKKVVREKENRLKYTKLKPKFILYATCNNLSRSDESIALVWMPGKGYQWIKEGSSLGHFIVEEIKKGMIVYSDGNELCKMAININMPVEQNETIRTALASNHTYIYRKKDSLKQQKPVAKAHKPLHKISP